MPKILPFRAIHYDFARRPDLSAVVAPPYDVIDPAMRDALEAREPHNIVRLELEKERLGDTSAQNRYTRSARWLEAWLESEALVRDERPVLYGLRQTFEVEGRTYVRSGLFARLELRPFEDGVVLPHERTLPKAREDRLELLRATKTNVSPIFVLYPDEALDMQRRIDGALEAQPIARAKLGDTANELVRIDDPEAIARLTQGLEGRRGYVADGHHRYETGLAFARECAAAGAREDGAHRYVLAFLCSMSDPGLVILPTHRVVHRARIDLPRLLPLLDEHFDLEELAEDVSLPAGRAWCLRRLAEAGRNAHALAMITRGDRRARLLRLREGVDLAHVSALPKNASLRALDVTLLHALVLQHTLGITAEAQTSGAVSYVKDAKAAVDAVLDPSGEAPLAFLLNATESWQVRAIADAGEVMPPKSTYFYPKVPTGLVLNRADPAEPA